MPRGSSIITEHAQGRPPVLMRVARLALQRLGGGVAVSPPGGGALRAFETSPEGYSEGRQPGAARKADPAQRAFTAALGRAPDGAGIVTAEGSEARRLIPSRTPSRPARKGTRPAGVLSRLPVRDLDHHCSCNRPMAKFHLPKTRGVVGFAWLLRTLAEPLALSAGRLELWALTRIRAD